MRKKEKKMENEKILATNKILTNLGKNLLSSKQILNLSLFGFNIDKKVSENISQGIIKKQFSILRPRYNIDYKGWRLEGDFLRWNYDVYEQSRLVAHISKQLFRWGDTYVLDIANDADELPALMVAIAMDAAKCSEDDNRNSMI